MRYLCLAFAVCLAVSAPGAQAASVRLQWDPNTEPDLAGYRVYYGTVSRTYGAPLNVGNATTATVPLPDDGLTYHLAVTAYDTAQNESGYSNEVTYTTPLAPEAVSQPQAPAGPTDVGTGLQYVFTTGGAVSNHGHAVQYRFSWSDGTTSEWLPAGTLYATKSWAAPGTYTLVRTEARCGLHPSVVSPPSESLSVTVSASPAETISQPWTPSGATAADTAVPYTYSTGGAVSSRGDPVQYRFLWSDGTVSDWLPAGVLQAAKSWGLAGSYTPRVEARCAIHGSAASSPSDALTVSVAAATTETVTSPTVPSGPIEGRTGLLFRFVSAGAVSTRGDPVQYRFQWGDGTVSAWKTPSATGEVEAWKSWSTEGSYAVVAEARCALHAGIGAFSSALTVGILGGGGLIFYDTFVDGTPAGDPQWRRKSGAWRVTADKTYASASTSAVNKAVVSVLDPLLAGRLSAKIKLTTSSARNGAGIIFSLAGDRKYRYVLLQGTRLTVGQVGDYPGARAGVKASKTLRFRPGQWYPIRVDLRPDGRVEVFLGTARRPALTARFARPLAGSVGVAASKSAAYFDDFRVWDQRVFP